ncbi:hypothetical protein BJ912DRAFT_1001882 [Pholiota molesta]|nr:hypothetical protein BJ912DRAFT_1001882 [Pholiota molesta]
MAAVDTNPPKPALTGGFVNPVDGPFIRFPPFPEPPQNTTVVSYKDFKERGICIEPGPDDTEVDALGIPTVPLPKRHETDMCKTNTKRKRKAEEATARKKAGVPAAHVVWWEQWEETEVIRFSLGFNPHSTRFERIHAAAGDFTTGRTWPVNFASETGPRYIWEKFQRYIGIPEGSGAPPKEKKKAEQKDADDDISDDDMDDNEDEDEGLDQPTGTAADVINDRDLAGILAKNKAAATNEANLARFFDSPEKSIRVFMSSYAREQGYIWSDVNLTCMPRVLYFFINFLLRSKVLPESERSLRRAVEVIQTAQIELPNTASLAKILPDRFSRACNVSWGKKAEPYKLPEDIFDAGQDASEPKVEESKPDLPIPSKQDSGWGQEIDTVWNSATDSETPWGSSNDSNVWNAVETDAAEPTSGWILPNDEKLSEELGLTALPSTHRTGIVETSMRRVKTIVGPNANPPPKPPQAEGSSAPDPEAVEIDLDSKFTKVVLSPMPMDWDGGKYSVYSRPAILKTSQGAVVDPGVPVPEGTTPKPHDPLNDDITLLIESDVAHVELLREGMLLGGIWVQIVRQGEAAKKKKKGKSKKSAPVYWYVDELAIIAPSFWAVNVVDQESE